LRRRRVLTLSALALSLALVLAACSSNTAATGNLKLSVTGLPAGAYAAVEVSNGSYSQTVTSTITLGGLVPGTYVIAPQTVTYRQDPFEGTASSATVSVSGNNTASDAVTYAAKPANLWVTRGTNGGPAEYLGSSLASGSAQAGTTITGLNYPYGMAVDANGNFWVVNFGTDMVLEYSASSVASGHPTTLNSFSPGTNTAAEGIAFDANGNLWLTNYNDRTVVGYKASTLGSASPTKLSTITLPSGTGLSPSNLAFDANGNLWVAEPMNNLFPALASQVVEYTAASLVSASPATGTVITLNNNHSDIGLAFDASDNLWLGLYTSVVEYTAASLASGSPTTGTTINTGTTSNPLGLAFDVNGNLWVANDYGNSVVEYTASSLAMGSPARGTTIGGTTPIDITFDPPPYNLPLSQ